MPFKFNPFTGNFDLDGDVTINPKTAITPAPTDELLIADASDSYKVRKATAYDVLTYGQKDLNIGTLDFLFQANFAIGFTTNAKLYGQYLFVLSATIQLLIIDVSDPANPFLAGQLAGATSAFDLKQAGSLCFAFEANRLRVYDVSKVGSPTLLYGPTAAAGNVRCSSAADIAGSYLYTYNPNTTEFHAINMTDPNLPVKISTISTSAFTNLQHSIVYDDNVVFASGNSVLNAYDVSNPESIVLLSSLNTTTLSTSIDRIYSMKSLGSFLYCNCRITGTTNLALVILNKSNPASITEGSITQLNTNTIPNVPNLELFFPFCVLNGLLALSPNYHFFDVRYFDAPVLQQEFYIQTSTNFTMNMNGNNFYDIGFAGVDAYIIFGTNVSNALVGTVQAGKVEAYGEVAAGSVNVRGAMTCRDQASFQSDLSAKNVQAKNEVTAYRYRQLLRYMYMMGG